MITVLSHTSIEKSAHIYHGLPVKLLSWEEHMRVGNGHAHADMIALPFPFPPEKLADFSSASPALIQWHSIGYDGVSAYMPRHMRFANAASVFEIPTAEVALAGILAMRRGIRRSIAQQHHAQWERFKSPGIYHQNVTIIGAGGVGNRIADILSVMGAHVTRLATRGREDTRGHVYSIDRLADFLPTTDICVVAVPLTPSTHHLIDDAFLSQLNDDALVVNVSRGLVADTHALLAHAHRLDFYLDVTDPEPLPDNDPLWKSERVLISPHIGGQITATKELYEALLRRQAQHLLAGEQPENLISFS